jgi:hypothetical protein
MKGPGPLSSRSWTDPLDRVQGEKIYKDQQIDTEKLR